MEEHFSALCKEKGIITTTFTGIETFLVKTRYFQERMKLKCDTHVSRVS